MPDWLPSKKAEELVARVTELSAPAPTVVNLLGLLNRADVDQPAVEQAVERDAVLSAKLLALANSAYFGLAEPVASLREVLFYLGHGEVYRLAIAVSLSGILSRKALTYAMDEGELWRHSFLTAKCAETLVSSAGSVELDESTSYTGGLLHDIGKIVLNQVLPPDLQRELNATLESRAQSGIAAEQKVLGTDHAEVGACLLHQWRLPEPIIEAAAFHHQLFPGPVLTISNVVYLANSIAHSVATAQTSDHATLLDDAARVGISPDSVERLIATSSELLRQLEQLSSL